MEPRRTVGIESQLEAVAALQEPLRRALYFYVASQDAEVSRDQAAEGLGISRALAAFHLDKLVGAGLLESSYRRLTGRSGPGAGRPSKLYRRSAKAVRVSLPPRSHDLAAQLLAGALAEGGGAEAIAALERSARAWGLRFGKERRSQLGPRPSRRRLVAAALDALADLGFEPRRQGDGTLTLRNCPFDARHSGALELMCGMNVALCRGLLEGLEVPGLEARLEPGPDRCCVVFHGS